MGGTNNNKIIQALCDDSIKMLAGIIEERERVDAESDMIAQIVTLFREIADTGKQVDTLQNLSQIEFRMDFDIDPGFTKQEKQLLNKNITEIKIEKLTADLAATKEDPFHDATAVFVAEQDLENLLKKRAAYEERPKSVKENTGDVTPNHPGGERIRKEVEQRRKALRTGKSHNQRANPTPGAELDVTPKATDDAQQRRERLRANLSKLQAAASTSVTPRNLGLSKEERERKRADLMSRVSATKKIDPKQAARARELLDARKNNKKPVRSPREDLGLFSHKEKIDSKASNDEKFSIKKPKK